MVSDESLPTVSIIIPTFNSEKVIKDCLRAARNQNYPKNKFEIIVADNFSKDKTVSISEDLGARVILVNGRAPQVCVQRNLGADAARFEYLLFLDHDMELSPNLLRNFAEKVIETSGGVDAWYVPERIVGNGAFWTKVRNFERSFYNSTVVDAVRIIKKEKFQETEKYDVLLSSGPADWDMDNQLKQLGCNFGIIDEYLYHHEELLSLRRYLVKKTKYTSGGLIYHEKWKRKSEKVYNEVVRKQYNAWYRFVGIFFRQGHLSKVARGFYLYIAFVFIKLCVGVKYSVSKYNKR